MAEANHRYLVGIPELSVQNLNQRKIMLSSKSISDAETKATNPELYKEIDYTIDH